MSKPLSWKLPALLKREGISAYRLHKQLAPQGTSPTTIYRWAKELPTSLDMALLRQVIVALRELTGKPINVQDLLEYQEG